MDYVMDALSSGRRIKCLTCLDDFRKECLRITAAFGISGVQLTCILDSIALFRGHRQRQERQFHGCLRTGLKAAIQGGECPHFISVIQGLYQEIKGLTR